MIQLNMVKRITCLTLLTLILLSSCREKSSTNAAIKTDDLNIKPILIAQVQAGNDETYGSFEDYGEKDLNALVSIADTILTNNGYKKPDVESFSQRIRDIFGRVIDQHSKSSYLKIDYYADLCNKQLLFAPYTADNQYLYVAKKERFITNFYAIPLMLDYLAVFPDLAAYEKKDIEIYDEVEKTKTSASQWKDNLKGLSAQRQQNILQLINRNKYLFNEDKNSLAWLMKNDQTFLSSLLTMFGYDREAQINQMVLDSVYNAHTQKNTTGGEFIASLFFVKDCNHKLQIRTGLLKYVEAHTSAKDNRFIYALGDYMYTLYDEKDWGIFDELQSKKFTALEKAKIVAYIASVENPAIEKYKNFESVSVWNNAGSNLYNISVSHPEVIKLIEKNNYFGLPNMKAIIAKLAEEAPAPGGDPL